jgi:glyoxylase-like metal-dependent hydrolase (beta-lactamase superfamily II)
MLVRPEEFFPTIPSVYWENNPDAIGAAGYVSMSAGGLLVEHRGHRLLIDAGLGPVNAEAWGAPMRTGAFLDTLEALGYPPRDIDVPAFTHMSTSTTAAGLCQTARMVAVPQPFQTPPT